MSIKVIHAFCISIESKTGNLLPPHLHLTFTKLYSSLKVQWSYYEYFSTVCIDIVCIFPVETFYICSAAITHYYRLGSFNSGNTSHGSGGWKSETRVPVVGFWRRPPSWFTMDPFLLCPHWRCEASSLLSLLQEHWSQLGSCRDRT